ncbi:MAG: ABC transporter permease [Dehalococcoidia bacterium]|nr:ABC transporter permease [Dehalococcoidia bacterium]
MGRALVRRVVLAAGVLILLNGAVFLAIRLVPGDPVRVALGEQLGDREVEALRRELGLDRPLWEQLVRFAGGVLRGELGSSLRSGRPVADEVGRTLPVSVALVATAVAVGGAAGTAAGWFSAARAGSRVDALVSSSAAVAASLPAYLVASVLLVVFAGRLRWFPSGGYDSWWHLVLPVTTLALSEGAVVARVSRAAIREVLHSDFVRTAAAKGLRAVRITLRHVLPNAMVPVVSLLAADFGRLVGGAVVIESVFAVPGVGYLVVEAVRYRDYTVLQGAVLVLSAVSLLAGLAGDVAAAAIDPRLRDGQGAGAR